MLLANNGDGHDCEGGGVWCCSYCHDSNDGDCDGEVCWW